MGSRTIVVSALAILLASASPIAARGTGRGAEIYQLCAQCHAKDANGNPAFRAPAIAGLQQWYIERQLQNFRAGLRGVHPEDYQGMRMRPMALTLTHAGDVEDVAGYIANLTPRKPAPSLTGGDSAKGSQYFKTCLVCHGPDAAGTQKMNAPRLALASDWYLFDQLKNFRAGRRGTNPADTNGLLMRSMALTLPDEQAVRDVIAYIMTLSK